jgi:hypothetical protein
MKTNNFLCKAGMAICICVALSTSVIAGVDGNYGKGMLLAQAGIGLGFYGTLYGSTSIPPICASADYGVTDLISVGGGLGIAGSKYEVGYLDYNWSFTYTYIPIMGRVAFHPFNLPALKNKIPKRDIWDTYGGLALGWTIINYSETDPPNSTGIIPFPKGTSYFTVGLLLGIRYYFSPRFGVYAEEGSGFGWFNIGCVFKLK